MHRYMHHTQYAKELQSANGMCYCLTNMDAKAIPSRKKYSITVKALVFYWWYTISLYSSDVCTRIIFLISRLAQTGQNSIFDL